MKKACYRNLHWLACSAGVLLSGAAYGVNLYTIDTEEPEPRQSGITFTLASPSLHEGSSAAQVEQDLGHGDMTLGGVEDFYYANDPDSAWRVFMDGRWLVHPEQIRVSLEMFKPEKYFLNLDVQHWMEYDNPAGIYYPATGAWYTLSGKALEEELNRVQVTLRGTPSDTIEWKLAYSFLNRDGQSLSTSFGDNRQYAVTGPKARKLVPAIVEGEETVHTVDLTLQREEEANRTGVRLHYQRREVDRQRVAERAADQPAANRFTRQEESSVDDLFGFSAFTRKQLNTNVVGSAGLAFTRLDGDITGSRVFGATPDAAYDIAFAGMQLNDRGFLDLEGTRRLKQWIANANLVYEPEGNWRWMTGIRLELLSTDAFGSYIDTWDRIDWAMLERQKEEADMVSSSKKDATDVSVFLEGRYKGIQKVVLYTRIEAGNQDGDLDEDWLRTETAPDAGDTVNLLDRATDFRRDRLFAQAGANYYPTAGLKFSVEGYYKYQDNGYEYADVSQPDEDYTLYPGYLSGQEIETQDVNARVHWRILPTLKSVSRIDLQENLITSTNLFDDETRSADRDRLVANQSLTWTPMPRLFVSGALTYVEDLTKTPAVRDTPPFDGIIVNLPNDYWQADVDLYYVLSKLVDVQLGYHYVEIDNYLNTSPNTVPYGTDVQQHHVLGSLIFHLDHGIGVRLGYQYYKQNDLASAGNRDYEVHILSTSVQAKF